VQRALRSGDVGAAAESGVWAEAEFIIPAVKATAITMVERREAERISVLTTKHDLKTPDHDRLARLGNFTPDCLKDRDFDPRLARSSSERSRSTDGDAVALCRPCLGKFIWPSASVARPRLDHLRILNERRAAYGPCLCGRRLHRLRFFEVGFCSADAQVTASSRSPLHDRA
jgi:hypothetical protein